MEDRQMKYFWFQQPRMICLSKPQKIKQSPSIPIMLSSNRSFHCCWVAHEGLRKINTASKQFSNIWRKQGDKYGGFPILHPRAPGSSVTHHTATMLLTAWKQGPTIFYVGTWFTTPLPYPSVRTWPALPLTNPHIGTWSVMLQPPPRQLRHIPV